MKLSLVDRIPSEPLWCYSCSRRTCDPRGIRFVSSQPDLATLLELTANRRRPCDLHLQRAAVEYLGLPQLLPPDADCSRGDQDHLPAAPDKGLQLLHKGAQPAQGQSLILAPCDNSRANLRINIEKA